MSNDLSSIYRKWTGSWPVPVRVPNVCRHQNAINWKTKFVTIANAIANKRLFMNGRWQKEKNYSRSWHRGNTSSGIISPVIWIDNIVTMKKKERTICVGTKKRNPKRHKVSDRNEIKREQTKKKDKLNTLLYLGILSKTDFLYILSLSCVHYLFLALTRAPPPSHWAKERKAGAV